MNRFSVHITEHLERDVTILAESPDAALAKVADSWRSSEIVLDSSDFTYATASIGETKTISL